MTNISLAELTRELKEAILELSVKPEVSSLGIVTKVSDGIVWIYGLQDCGYNEMIEIATAKAGQWATAFALNLEEDQIGAVILGDDAEIFAGARAKLTGRILEVPVGTNLVGRVVDPLGRPLDGKGPLDNQTTRPIEQIAPGVMQRQAVSESLATGIKAIDAMVPIGRGQRELIIGDRQTGKTAIAIDTIINQTIQKTDVISIYVAIGQKMSKVAGLVERLKSAGALERTIVVATSAADPAALQYLAPYAGTAMGEFFRDGGQHALIVYDDLSKHAWAYRQISLLLRRPPGREAYPGDVFYLHSRLLERAAKLAESDGGGSLTALPIIETQAGDVSAYIPTNVISITDGQIYLETDLFYQGIRPAMSVGLSVSRVGGAAQTKAIKSLAGGLRLDLAQYRELAAFAQFATDLDENTQRRLERGSRITEILKQAQYSPMSLAQEVVTLVAVTAGCFDSLPLSEIKAAETRLLERAAREAPSIMAAIAKTGELTADNKDKLIKLASSVAAESATSAAPEPGVK